jgi:hypothetical protein
MVHGVGVPSAHAPLWFSWAIDVKYQKMRDVRTTEGFPVIQGFVGSM